MSVKEVRQALGGWGLTLKANTPRELIEEIERNKFGHIAIIPGRINPKLYGDALLQEARYVGVYRSTFKQSDDTIEIKGSGMAFWLGDEDDKGDIFEEPVVFDAETFPNVIRALLPPSGAVTEGMIHSVPGDGTYSGRHQWETPRQAMTYVTDTYTAGDFIVEFRVNGDGTLDAGPITELYNMTPKAILVRKDTGRDMRLLGVRADMSMDYDVEDLTTKIVLLAQGEGETIATGTADAPPTGYLDLHGNPIVQTRLVSESNTDPANAEIRAQIQLKRWSVPRQAIQIRTDEFDIKGDFVVGDYIYVFDPEAGFYDLDNEVYWRGQPINPIALRVTEMDWNIRVNWTVAFRKNNGEWLDLSEYYRPETGGSRISVGDYRRTLAGNNYESIGFRPNLPNPEADASVPAPPEFTGFSVGSYQSHTMGWVKSAIRAAWNEPLNTDGSVITDGSHYEMNYRVNQNIGYTVGWDALSGYQEIASDNFHRDPILNGWGASTSGDIWTTDGGSASDFSAGNGHGVMTMPDPGISLLAYLSGVDPSDVAMIGAITLDQEVTDSYVQGGIGIRRAADGSSHLCACAQFFSDGSTTVSLQRKGGAGDATLVSANLGNYTVGDKLWVVVYAIGAMVKAHAWFESRGPSRFWTLEATETLVMSGDVFAMSIRDASNTDDGASISYSDIVIKDLDPSFPYSWGDLGTWDALLSEPISESPQWMSAIAGWDANAFTITELTPGVTYEIRIRAIDAANPPNMSAWSNSAFVTTTGDIFAPSTPAAPIVASSMIAIQVQHNLGKSSGGEFNLEMDLDHLDIHVGGSPSFLATPGNKVGELIATGGMVNGRIPAVGTFKIDNADTVYVKVVAVDSSGNKSSASNGVQASVELIDNAHISDLSVSKVTAGTITATWVMAGAIKTAHTGARVEIDSDGIRSYDSSGNKTTGISAVDGSGEFTGSLKTDSSGNRVYVNSGGDPSVQFVPADGKSYYSQLSGFSDELTSFEAAIELGIKDLTSGIQEGGKLLLWNDGAIFSFQPSATGRDERYIGIESTSRGGIYLNAGRGSDSGGVGPILLSGRFENFATVFDSGQAFFALFDKAVANGPALSAYSFGATMTRTLYPIFSIKSTTDTQIRITAQSNTGFTVQNLSATSASINVICFASD